MTIDKTNLIYTGKSKSVYACSNPEQVILLFRDDATAFNGEKKAVLTDKGKINNQFNAFIMEYLKNHDIPCHFERRFSPTESLAKKVEIIPVECVIRNVAAGSISKRLGIPEGQALHPSVFEFFLKNDALGDPFINEDHIYFLKLATPEELQEMRRLTFKVNQALTTLFKQAGLLLVDFKLEFGRFHQQLLLADEISPDSCRVWDIETGERLDKDRFRRDLGDVMQGYQAICDRLGISISD